MLFKDTWYSGALTPSFPTRKQDDQGGGRPSKHAGGAKQAFLARHTLGGVGSRGHQEVKEEGRKKGEWRPKKVDGENIKKNGRKGEHEKGEERDNLVKKKRGKMDYYAESGRLMEHERKWAVEGRGERQTRGGR